MVPVKQLAALQPIRMIQSKEEIEASYQTPDPWGYQSSNEDRIRKERIVSVCRKYAPFLLALDVGCGEGWISEALPAKIVHGYEISDAAAARFPVNVRRVINPDMRYDLVVTTGTLYGHYDWQGMTEIIRRCASRILAVSYIAAWEFAPAIDRLPGKQIEQIEFPYNEHTQRLRVYDLTA